MELFVWGKSSGTLWNFIMGQMERNNYGTNERSYHSYDLTSSDLISTDRVSSQLGALWLVAATAKWVASHRAQSN